MSSQQPISERKRDFYSWQGVADYIEAKSEVFAVALCVCFALSSLAIATRRPFWYDEILTVLAARTPGIKDLLSKFLFGYDQTPPLNAIFVRLSSDVFGWTELAARLPSTFFATAGLFILFHRIRSLANGLMGLAAISILTTSFLPMWAYEARPYAMLFFASALALSLWTSAPDASDGSTGKTRSILFGVAVMLAVFSHYYGVLLIVPFIAEEAKNRGLRKLISLPTPFGRVILFLFCPDLAWHSDAISTGTTAALRRWHCRSCLSLFLSFSKVL